MFSLTEERLNDINWTKGNGLIPGIIQNHRNLKILMLGYLSKESLKQTLRTGKVTFFSRSKNRLWVKGESSGNYLKLNHIVMDCDSDALLIKAQPVGPTCHTGTHSCFQDPLDFLKDLENIIKKRSEGIKDKSYTNKLMRQGAKRVAQKVGEEAVEVALAALGGERQEIIEESADLLFHFLLNLQFHKIQFEDVVRVLIERHEK